MFLATHLPSPLPPSAATSISLESATPSSPAITAALDRFDLLIRNALGRVVYGDPYGSAGADGAPAHRILGLWTTDDLIASLTMVVVFFIAFLVLLVLKLVLGMLLLRYARGRYAAMKSREHAVAAGKAERETFDATGGKRIGGFGAIEVGDDRRRWLYDDDKEGLRKARDRERRAERAGSEKEKDYSSVMRYEMVAKRIW